MLRRFSIRVRSGGSSGSVDSNGIDCSLSSIASSNFLQLSERLVRTTRGARCGACSRLIRTCGTVSSRGEGGALFIINEQCCVGCGRNSGGDLHRIGLCTSLVQGPRSRADTSLQVIPTGVMRCGVNACAFLSRGFSCIHASAPLFFGVPIIDFRGINCRRDTFGVRRTVRNGIRLRRGRGGDSVVRITVGANVFGHRAIGKRSFSCTCPFASCRREPRKLMSALVPCSLDLGSMYPSDVNGGLSSLGLFRSSVPCAVRFVASGLPSIGGIFLVNGGRCLYRGVRTRVSIGKVGGIVGNVFCEVS